jgi:hypothetical protein
MAAYRRTHKVTEEEAERVRQELLKFIDDMRAGKLPDTLKSTRPPSVRS